MSEQNAGDTLTNHGDTTVTVTRSVSVPARQLWKHLVTKEGAEALLGAGGVLGDKGDSWSAADGTYGVIRSYHPLEQIRFSWHAAPDAPKTIVDVRLGVETEQAAVISIVHEAVPAYFDAAALTRRWEAALDSLVAAAEAGLVTAG